MPFKYAPNWSGMASNAKWIGSEFARYAGKAWGTNTGRGAMIGAGAGAGWGMLSDDTSVIGGAVMGAGLGAGVGRYGMRGYRAFAGARAGGLGMGGALKAGGLDAWGGVRSDATAAWGWGKGRVASWTNRSGSVAMQDAIRRSGGLVRGPQMAANRAALDMRVDSSVAGGGWRGGGNRKKMQRAASRAAYNVGGGRSGVAARGYLQTMGF